MTKINKRRITKGLDEKKITEYGCTGILLERLNIATNAISRYSRYSDRDTNLDPSENNRHQEHQTRSVRIVLWMTVWCTDFRPAVLRCSYKSFLSSGGEGEGGADLTVALLSLHQQ